MIGACLHSVFTHKGSHVTGYSHVGDFGSPLGSVIAEIMEEGEEKFPLLGFLSKGEDGKTPANLVNPVQYLKISYRRLQS